MRDKPNIYESNISFLFLLIPAFLLVIGYTLYPFSPIVKTLLIIPIFVGLILLFIGFLLNKKYPGVLLRIIGWCIFGFFWSTQPAFLFFSEGEDFVNASICVIGVFVLFYFAYHEWLSISKNYKSVSCLNWIAGAASISGLIYYTFEITPLTQWLIEIVAYQSGWFLNIFTGGVEVFGDNIYYNGEYTVTIIFACTAVQSMVIFIGMILPLKKVEIKKIMYGLIVTIIPVYLLNLMRNALIIFLMGENITSFYIAHNILGKSGSLIALVALLFIVSKIVPEVFDEIICLIDLRKRKGPIENFMKKIFLGRK